MIGPRTKAVDAATTQSGGDVIYIGHVVRVVYFGNASEVQSAV